MSDKYSNSLQVNSLMATRAQIETFECQGNLLLVSNGSAAAPSLRFSSSPSTGLWLPDANTIGLAAAGNNLVSISNSAVTLQRQLDQQAAQPCLIYNYASQSVSNGAALLLSTASGGNVRNVANLFVSNAGANAFVVPSAGTYLVNSYVEFAANVDNSRVLSISANGAIVQSVRVRAAPTGVTSISASAIWQVAANGNIGISVLQDCGGSLNATGQVSVFRIA